MNEADIENVLGQHLLGSHLDYPVAWPNKDFPAGVATYLVFQVVRTSVASCLLAGVKVASSGYVMIGVVDRANNFAVDANRIADIVAGNFRMGLRIAVPGGGEITISQPPQIMSGYPDGPAWRVPVKVHYTARN